MKLTIVGSDTPTAPLGVSMRDQLLALVADDPRIEMRDSVDRAELPALVRSHHAVAIPSLWECWPNVGLEALHLNRPLLATPVGGLVEMVEPGASGVVARTTGARAIDQAITQIVDEREQLAEMIRSGGPARRGRELASNHEVVDAYRSLPPRPARGGFAHVPDDGGASGRRSSRRSSPITAMARFVGETIESLVGQTYPRVEIVVVNDGSFEEADWVLGELATKYPLRIVTQQNRGLGAARNLGVTVSRGRYIFPLDADNVAEPEFVERCVAVLEARPELAYVTSWLLNIDEAGEPRWGADAGWQPIGNESVLNDERNVAGDAAALLRRRLFERFRYSEELTSYEDWHLYRRLARAGEMGAVIPERLIRYRVRADSMQAAVAEPNRERLHAEMDALTPRGGDEMDVVERLTLEAASAETLIATEHRHRYELAAELLAGQGVLDLCCGSGYGTEILAGAGCQVVGVDNDVATVDLARVTVGERTAPTFEAADALAYLRGAEAESLDAIACFEGLEHLPDLDAVLARLKELAEDGMREVLSVPNSKFFDEDNPHHLTDFGYEEARAAFAEFPATVMVPQYLAEGSLIVAPDPAPSADGGDPGETEPEAALWLEDRREPEYANHFIFCVNCDLEAVTSRHRGRLRLEAAPLYNRYMRFIERANRELMRTNSQLMRMRLGTSGSAAAAYLAKLEKAKADHTEDVTNWIGRSRLAEARIVELERELDEARAALRAQDGGLPGKLRRKLR